MHMTGITAMATEIRRIPVESDWHADGLNIRPECLKGLRSAENWSMGECDGSTSGRVIRDFSEIRKKTHAII